MMGGNYNETLEVLRIAEMLKTNLSDSNCFMLPYKTHKVGILLQPALDYQIHILKILVHKQ